MKPTEGYYTKKIKALPKDISTKERLKKLAEIFEFSVESQMSIDAHYARQGR